MDTNATAARNDGTPVMILDPAAEANIARLEENLSEAQRKYNELHRKLTGTDASGKVVNPMGSVLLKEVDGLRKQLEEATSALVKFGSTRDAIFARKVFDTGYSMLKEWGKGLTENQPDGGFFRNMLADALNGKAQQQREKAMSAQAAALKDDVKTPWEKAQEKLQSYLNLLRAGKLDQDTFNRLIDRDQNQLDTRAGSALQLARTEERRYDFRSNDAETAVVSPLQDLVQLARQQVEALKAIGKKDGVRVVNVGIAAGGG